jgi:putative oxidoreductase
MKKLPFYNFSGNLIIRLMVGLVFLSEGVQKLILPEIDGAGRFIKIGIPYPQFFSLFTGITEIICGSLLISGFLTRIAAVPLLIVICTAIYTTKIPIFVSKGFWAAAHEARADFCMIAGLIFLFCYGAGKYSIDSRFHLNGRK